MVLWKNGEGYEEADGDADAEYDQESPQVLSKEEVPERLQS